jgi:hypothetical protein
MEHLGMESAGEVPSARLDKLQATIKQIEM